MNTPGSGGGSRTLLYHWGKDFQLWFYFTLTLQLFRLLLIGLFGNEGFTEEGIRPVLVVMANGLRFDISTAALWIAPTFLLSLSIPFYEWSERLTRIRLRLAQLFVIAVVIIAGIDLLYFEEYGDQFNQHLFGIAHDDTIAILITIWKEYHPLWFLTITALTVFIKLRLVRYWMQLTPHPVRWLGSIARPARKLAGGLMLFFIFVAAVRGGTLWGEPIRLKHAFVVNDLFLNRTVLNPFSALRYTLKVKLELERGAGLAGIWPGADIAEALALESQSRGHALAQAGDIDRGLQVTAKGRGGEKPRHIFMLLMESHSGWTVMPQYRHAGLSPKFSALADKGIYFPNFLPSASGTIGSMNAIITGLPDAGLNINYETTALKPYPSAIAETFRRLGYRTRFFYGGYLSWQRLDTFGHSQGFDEVYGGGSMSDGVATNEWGVDDKYLFDFILKTVDDETPSFNFILTTSNHPPYDLDLDALGFPLKKLPRPLKATKADTLKILGHLWYAERQAGAFVERAEQQLSKPLFAVSGDHTARLQIRFPGDNVVEQFAVPFILYGPTVLDESGVVKLTAGSHTDIPATLIELAADAGFPYTSFGENMLDKHSPSLGLGNNFFIGEHYIASHSSEPKVYSLGDGTLPAPSTLKSAAKRLNALKALSWYRVKKGSTITSH